MNGFNTLCHSSLIAAVALTAGCVGDSHVYRPEGANTWSQGRPVTRVQIPPEQPNGEVRLAAVGMTQLAAGDQTIDALHIRMTVGNDGDDTTWTIDTREQLLEIPGEGRSRPVLANSDRQSMPLVTIARREQRMVDLYYPLPTNMDDEDDLGQFELMWQVQTGDRLVAQRTRFDRVTTEPDYGYSTTLHAGWGPYWWYDPFYPRYMFIHRRPIFIRDHSRVIVQRPPRGNFEARRQR